MRRGDEKKRERGDERSETEKRTRGRGGVCLVRKGVK